MENASKALIMAAGVLISILILSLMSYLIVTFGSFASEVHKENQQNEILAFNSQFMAYQGKENLTIYDIITVANYANENNKYYELDSTNRAKKSTYYVEVKIKSKNVETNDKTQWNSEISKDVNDIKQESSSLPTYKCSEIEISNVTGRVYSVTFEKNNN